MEDLFFNAVFVTLYVKKSKVINYHKKNVIKNKTLKIGNTQLFHIFFPKVSIFFFPYKVTSNFHQVSDIHEKSKKQPKQQLIAPLLIKYFN